MDYFYQYDSKVTARSHRESIRKINDVITPRPAWKKETDNGLFVKPFYDTFNFPKAVEPVRLKNASLMNNRASKELFKFTKTLSKEEMALAKVLHTTEHISSKIEAQEHFLLQKQKARPEMYF